MPLYKQTLSWTTDKSLPICDVLCAYGSENIDFKTWLEESPGRYLILLNEQEVSSSFQDDERVRHYVLSKSHEEEIFKQIAWEFVFLNIGFYIDRESDSDRAQEIFSKIHDFHRGVHLLASDYRDLGRRVLKNIFSNILHLPQALEGEKLGSRFQNIPAIICGAGPSLEKNSAQLSQLSSHALIFAGGSSLNVLSAHAIDPHFSASIDPDPPYQRFLQQTAFEAPFFYQNRVSKELLDIVHAPLVRFSDGAVYPIDNWLSSYFGIASQPFESGWNVATFLTAIAAFMGCNPIVFVGMDLASSDGRVYANGVAPGSFQEEWVEIKKENGHSLFSKKDWIIAAEWIESFARAHSEITFVNCSEGGIGFTGIADLSLREAEQKYLKNEFDLKGMVHAQLMRMQNRSVRKEHISEGLKRIKNSLSRCQEHVDELLDAIERSYPSLLGIDGRMALFEVEIENEIAHEHVLSPIWEVWKYIFARQTEKSKLGQILNKILFFKKMIQGIYDRREI